MEINFEMTMDMYHGFSFRVSVWEDIICPSFPFGRAARQSWRGLLNQVLYRS